MPKPTPEENNIYRFLIWFLPVFMFGGGLLCGLSKRWDLGRQLLFGLPFFAVVIGLFAWKFVPFAKQQETRRAELGARRIEELQQRFRESTNGKLS